MTSRIVFAHLLLTMLIGPALVRAAEPAPKQPAPHELVKCPVCAAQANLAVSLATDDVPVFFCRKECREGYEKDASRHADAVAAQRVATAALPKVQVLCPVDGNPCSRKFALTAGEATIHFCGEACRAKYETDPAAFKSGLAGSYTWQTKCPVMSKTISPKWSTKLVGGETVYFCCGRCPAPYAKNPQRYASALTTQGFTFASFEPAKVEEPKPKTDTPAGDD